MHLLAIEEEGLRCLLRVASQSAQVPVPIEEIAQAEGLAPDALQPILTRLREGGLVLGDPAKGYLLARPAGQVSVWEAINVLGCELFPEGLCDCHPSARPTCAHNRDDAVSALWQRLREALQRVLQAITLDELLREDTSAAPGAGPDVHARLH